jgi:hypothetical protein
MRTPSPACVAMAALLAGCSAASQGAGTVPAAGPADTSAASVVLSGKMTPSKLLELQAAGKLPGPLPSKVLQWQRKRMRSHVRPLVAAKKCSTAAWFTAPSVGYLLGMDSSLQNVCKAVDIEKLGADFPLGVKVDGSRNVWLADEFNSAGNGGVVQEFGARGNLHANYNWFHCLDGYTDCYGYGYDVAENSKNVFAAVTYWYSENASGSDHGAGFAVFASGSPSDTPAYVSAADQTAGTYCSPVCSVAFVDVDNSGNLWFDFEGNSSGCQDGGGLGEVTNPTGSATVSVILPPCTYEYPGGVYVSNHGKVLNVTDEYTRDTYQYHLPVTAGSKPFNTLGPTAANGEGLGNPVAGGFNANDTELLLGDGYGWFDLGTVATNKWQAISTLNCPSFLDYGCAGAAFTPSDK